MANNANIVGRGHGRPTLVNSFDTFTSPTRAGSVLNADGLDPNGNASGALLVVTVSGIFGNTADGAASGATLPVTVSLIAGSAEAIYQADGDIVTVTASIAVEGDVHTSPIDGTGIYEFSISQAQSQIYQESNYDSIYGRGDRIANGLLQGGEYGWSVVFSPGSEGFDHDFGGNGPAAGGTTEGAAFWFSTVAGETLDIRGFTLIGDEEIDSFENFWSFRGGYSPGVYSDEPYFNLITAHNPNQVTPRGVTEGFDNNYFLTAYEDEPEFYSPFSHYEFVYIGGPRPDVRWTNEIWLKIAHSGLDGGDRRESAAAPHKQVKFTYSSHWGFIANGDNPNYDTPNETLFDGKYEDDTSKLIAGPGQSANPNNPVTTVGAWWAFEFPRPVIPKHFMLVNFNNAEEEYDSGDNPQHYGVWHWEFSEDSGGSWTAVGDPWSFRENCIYMVAPREPDFALGAVGEDGVGATHWRMVLDAGPAFGNARSLNQIIFDLDDVTGQAPPYTIAFSDDADGVLPVPTIGPPGSPFIVRFSDGSDDGMTFTVENIPNPVLTADFTDEGQFDTWSDLYPSIVVQTIVIATGR